MLTEEQLRHRQYTLGASEIAAVAGLNPWKSGHDVWLSKMGLADDKFNARTRIGELVEPIIARVYCEDQKVDIAHFGTLTHPKHPWMSATPDFMVGGVRRLGEIKMVGWRSATFWSSAEDGVPDYYRPQAEWQMEVCDADECDFAALLGGTDFRIYRIKRDRDLAGMLIDIGAKFWRDHIETKKPPPVDGSEGAKRLLKKIYPKNTSPMRSATSHEELVVSKLVELDRLEAERDLYENKLKESIADAEGLAGDGWSVTYRADVRGRRSLRWKQKKGRVAA